MISIPPVGLDRAIVRGMCAHVVLSRRVICLHFVGVPTSRIRHGETEAPSPDEGESLPEKFTALLYPTIGNSRENKIQTFACAYSFIQNLVISEGATKYEMPFQNQFLLRK